MEKQLNLQKLTTHFRFSDYRANQLFEVIDLQKELEEFQKKQLEKILHNKTRAAEIIEEFLLDKLKNANSPKEMEVFINRSTNKDTVGVPFKHVIIQALAINSEDYIDHYVQIFFDRVFYEKDPIELEKSLNKAWFDYAEVKFFEGHNPEKIMCFWFRLLI